MKWIVMTESPEDGLPPVLIMGVTEESNMEQVIAWAGENPRRRWCVTEKMFKEEQ